jgi:hypothetical protein
MKKIKVLRVRNQEVKPQVSTEIQSPDDVSMADAEQAISVESVQIKPTDITRNGFTSWVRRILPTRDGMESRVEKPMLFAKSGHRVKESEIKGRCEAEACGGLDSYIFNCDIAGCKKSLCLKHVYFFEYGRKKTPYCLGHFKQAMDEYDTWQEHDNRRR